MLLIKPHLSVEDLKAELNVDPSTTDLKELKNKWYLGPLSLFCVFEFALIFPANLDYVLTVLLPPIT